MTAATFELIRAMCHKKKPSDYVFTREDGERIQDFRGAWTAATKAAGVPALLVHDLRRSAVRRMIQRGIPQHVAMLISGHRTVSVFQRYAIVDAIDLRDAARKLEPIPERTVDTQSEKKAAAQAANVTN